MVWTENVAYAIALDRMILHERARLMDDAHAEHVQDTTMAIASVLRVVFARSVDSDTIIQRVATIRQRQQQLAKLLLLPGIEQRTDAWYAARHDMVTASDIDAAIKNGASREFLKKKCGQPPCATQTSAVSSGGPAPLKHGVMFETVANAIYRKRHGGGCVVHEFGLLRHDTVGHLGASPDGINDLGVMVEIKCPYSRKIDGSVPAAYFAQIQGQLEVCGLVECDYVEVEIVNSLEATDFYAAVATASGTDDEYGVVIERSGPVFEYSPLISAMFRPADDLLVWEQGHAAGATTVHRWRMDRFNVIRVERNPSYVADMLSGLATAWALVQRYRSDPAAFKREVTDAPLRPGRDTTCRSSFVSTYVIPTAYAFVSDDASPVSSSPVSLPASSPDVRPAAQRFAAPCPHSLAPVPQRYAFVSE